MMKRIFTLIIVLGALMPLKAQDIHFSQFYMAPLDLNPALTGVMNCNMRFTANFRNQWAAVLKNDAYNTYMLSYDQKVPVGRYDYFGFGGTLWGDRAGALDFGTLQVKLSGSYSKRLGGSRTSAHYMVFGANAGLTQRSINFQNAQFGSQNNDGSFDPTLNSGETAPSDNFLFADVAAGLLWFSVLDERTNFYFGLAGHHLNEANQSFYNGSIVPLYSKYTFHAGAQIGLTRDFFLVPGFVAFFQGPSFQYNGGTNFRFQLSRGRNGNQTFDIGLWARVSNAIDAEGTTFDAVILQTRFDYDNFGLGFSYDINTSPLRQASNANGSFEFSFIYNICRPERRGVYCPHF
jgi:type IX secretion system PorP/SprF family membrane protein